MTLKITRETLRDGTLRRYRQAQVICGAEDTPHRTEAEMEQLLEAAWPGTTPRGIYGCLATAR